jgi:hypothetical protein
MSIFKERLDNGLGFEQDFMKEFVIEVVESVEEEES